MKASREATDTKLIEMQALSPTTKAVLIFEGRARRDSNSKRCCDLSEDSSLRSRQNADGDDGSNHEKKKTYGFISRSVAFLNDTCWALNPLTIFKYCDNAIFL